MANKRQRKKELKKRGLYVNPRDTWSLDTVIARWMVPRLKEFKRLCNAFPGVPPYDTEEKWDEALDKMIRAFELVRDYEIIETREWERRDGYDQELLDYMKKIKEEINEGMHIFADNIQALWW